MYVPGVDDMSFIYAIKRRVNKQHPYGTPASICLDVDVSSSSLTLYVLSDIKNIIMDTSLGVVSSVNSLCSNPSCHNLSNVFSRSKNTNNFKTFTPLFIIINSKTALKYLHVLTNFVITQQ